MNNFKRTDFEEKNTRENRGLKKMFEKKIYNKRIHKQQIVWKSMRLKYGENPIKKDFSAWNPTEITAQNPKLQTNKMKKINRTE